MKIQKEREEKIMKDIKLAMYETLISNINMAIEKTCSNKTDNDIYSGILWWGTSHSVSRKVSNDLVLELIYDSSKCNDYARTILNRAEFYIEKTEKWDLSGYKSKDGKILDSIYFIQLCKMPENITEGYKFIFWALMILTVEKTDIEEHLSLICEYAKLLGITVIEFEDILQTVKHAYKGDNIKPIYKTQKMEKIFGLIFKTDNK